MGNHTLVRTDHLDQSMATKIEGNINAVSTTQLQKVAPTGRSLSSIRNELERGESTLISESPHTSLFVETEDGLELNTDHAITLAHDAVQTLVSRLIPAPVANWFSQTFSEETTDSLPPAVEPEMLPPENTPHDPAPQSTYRYNLEVACPPDMHQRYLPGIVSLAKVSGKEDAVTLSRNTEKLEHYWLKAMTITNDSRNLYYKPQGSTCSHLFSFEVALVDANTERADEALVPITPAVQVGKRLGFPTKGYFYHFYNGKLIQEFKIKEGTCSFSITSSYATTLTDDIKFNKLQSHILLYWRLHGEKVTNQHVLYWEEKLTPEELQHVTNVWLDENGLRIELAAIFAAKSESIVSGEISTLPRQIPQKYQRPENATYSCPSTLSLGTGMKPVTESSIDPQLPLINVKEIPCCPDCGKIGECKVNIDYGFIKEREGTRLQGYVPDPENSESGVTISSGFDLGCRNILDLKRLELDEALIEKLTPYLGKKRYDALTFLNNCPLEISPSQSTEIYRKVKKESTRRLIQRYNQDSLVKFKCLPKEAQTVIASVYYQFGNKIWNYNFGEHILHQDWQATYDELMNFGCEYPSRRKKEALVIKRVL